MANGNANPYTNLKTNVPHTTFGNYSSPTSGYYFGDIEQQRPVSAQGANDTYKAPTPAPQYPKWNIAPSVMANLKAAQVAGQAQSDPRYTYMPSASSQPTTPSYTPSAGQPYVAPYTPGATTGTGSQQSPIPAYTPPGSSQGGYTPPAGTPSYNPPSYQPPSAYTPAGSTGMPYSPPAIPTVPAGGVGGGAGGVPAGGGMNDAIVPDFGGGIVPGAGGVPGQNIPGIGGAAIPGANPENRGGMDTITQWLVNNPYQNQAEAPVDLQTWMGNYGTSIQPTNIYSPEQTQHAANAAYTQAAAASDPRYAQKQFMRPGRSLDAGTLSAAAPHIAGGMQQAAEAMYGQPLQDQLTNQNFWLNQEQAQGNEGLGLINALQRRQGIDDYVNNALMSPILSSLLQSAYQE